MADKLPVPESEQRVLDKAMKEGFYFEALLIDYRATELFWF